MKSGYLYVLVHPSDPDLYKIGVTIAPNEGVFCYRTIMKDLPPSLVIEVGT